MSSHSDSDEFFDAEDTTPVRTIRSGPADSAATDDKKKSSLQRLSKDEKPIAFVDTPHSVQFPVPRVPQEDIREAERKAKDNERRRKRVELRKRMLNDEEEVLEVPSDQSSLASSVEGVYPITNNLNLPARDPYGLNGEESRSIISLGKVGSILGDKDSLNADSREPDTISTDTKYSISESESLFDFNSHSYSKNAVFCPEPDVVASTKGGSGELLSRPVRPPRRKKGKKAEPSLHNIECPETKAVPEIPSPTDPVESLARELEDCSLDLRSATRGQYVVKPQDREQDRAEGPAPLDSGLKVETGGGLSPRNTHKLPESDSSLKKEISESPQPYIVRTRSDSGRPLTDQEILAQVTVRNLDTGEQIPLSLAEDRLPKCLNPLSLHIMRITSEYISNSSLEKESDEESIDSRKQDSGPGSTLTNRTNVIRKKIEKNVGDTFRKLKDKYHTRHGEEVISEEESLSDLRSAIKIKVSSSHKKPSEFEKIRVVQELSGEHSGAIWTMKFSSCGRLLATAGQDHDLRIWVLKDAYTYFDDMRQKYNAEGKSSPTPSQENISTSTSKVNANMEESSTDDIKGPFLSKPFCRYKGHTAELLDVSWSKNYFILSSSMDKTVRLWHISRQECLCCFQHIDFVTAIAFHPRDDRYFLSGSLDGKLRLWNIPDKKVTLWNELDGQTKLITAVNFCQNGKIAVVGSYDGRCIFYNTEQLKYYTQIHVRSTRGKNAQGRKISGIEAMPGEDKILITSNDSRIRLYDLRDLSLSCKYKGYVNLSSQIKASFSHDGKYVVSGSENQFIYLWKTYHDYAKFSSARRDRNDYWESIKAHNAVVTSAIFAPNPALILKQLPREQDDDVGTSASDLESPSCYVFVSADFSGIIKVFLLKSKNGASNISPYTN